MLYPSLSSCTLYSVSNQLSHQRVDPCRQRAEGGEQMMRGIIRGDIK